jgi:hypothetical protein
VHDAFLKMLLSTQPIAEIKHLQCATGFDCGSRLESPRKTPIGKVNHAVSMPQVAQAAAGCKQSVNIHEFGKAQQVYRVPHTG